MSFLHRYTLYAEVKPVSHPDMQTAFQSSQIFPSWTQKSSFSERLLLETYSEANFFRGFKTQPAVRLSPGARLA